MKCLRDRSAQSSVPSRTNALLNIVREIPPLTSGRAVDSKGKYVVEELLSVRSHPRLEGHSHRRQIQTFSITKFDFSSFAETSSREVKEELDERVESNVAERTFLFRIVERR